MNKDSFELLGACSEQLGRSNGVLHRAIGTISDTILKERMQQSLEVGDRLQQDILQTLEQGRVLSVGESFQNVSADASLADHLTNKCYADILELGKVLSRYPQADETAKMTVHKLIAAKEQMVYALRPYL